MREKAGGTPPPRGGFPRFPRISPSTSPDALQYVPMISEGFWCRWYGHGLAVQPATAPPPPAGGRPPSLSKPASACGCRYRLPRLRSVPLSGGLRHALCGRLPISCVYMPPGGRGLVRAPRRPRPPARWAGASSSVGLRVLPLRLRQWRAVGWSVITDPPTRSASHSAYRRAGVWLVSAGKSHPCGCGG